MAERQQNRPRRNQRGGNLRPPREVGEQYEFLHELQRGEANLIHASQNVVLSTFKYESMNVVGQEITERNITIESTAAVMRRKLTEAREKERPTAGIIPEGRVKNNPSTP